MRKSVFHHKSWECINYVVESKNYGSRTSIIGVGSNEKLIFQDLTLHAEIEEDDEFPKDSDGLRRKTKKTFPNALSFVRLTFCTSKGSGRIFKVTICDLKKGKTLQDRI